MTRGTSTNFTGANSFPIATATGDAFLHQDVQQLSAAVDAHNHTAGKGLAVGSGSALPYVQVQDQKSSGTQAGGSSANVWQTRDLNTIAADTTSAVTLASNRITLPSGTWECRISVPAFKPYGHQARLQNITDATTLLLGTTDYSDNAGNYAATRTFIEGIFTIGASKQLEVQHNMEAAVATFGLGIKAGRGTEIYTSAVFWKRA